MFSNRFAPAPLILAGLFGLSVATAQNQPCSYTLASLQGTYAVVLTYGANVAAGLQMEQFDGKGNVTRSGPINQPVVGSATGDRTIGVVSSVGTYTVNCDGSGLLDRVVTQANGVVSHSLDDMIITAAEDRNGALVATSIADMQRTASNVVPGGIFLTRVHTRLPSAGCYTLASLQGAYGVVLNYGANVAAGLQVEQLDGKGNVTRSGPINQPVVGSATGERTVGAVTSVGTYTVNCDGTGVINRVVTQASGATSMSADDMIITRAEDRNGVLIATAIADMQRTPSNVVAGGIFVTRVHTRLPQGSTGGGTTPPPSQAQTMAIAGPKNLTTVVRSIQLDGSQSTSVDGKPLTYLWTIPQGSPSAAILQGTTATPTVQFVLGHAVYTFQLAVTDSTGKTATDLVSVNFQGN